MDLEIPSNETNLIRVFAVNRAAEQMSIDVDTQGKDTVAAGLLGRPLPEDGFELFPVADLIGVGLTGYLGAGYAVPPAQLNAGRSKLEGLDGYVLLVFSSAFDGENVTLRPGPDLTLIGTYGEAQPDMSVRTLESDSATPYSGVPRTTPAAPPRGRAGGLLMVLGFIVLAGLVAWWLLS